MGQSIGAMIRLRYRKGNSGDMVVQPGMTVGWLWRPLYDEIGETIPLPMTFKAGAAFHNPAKIVHGAKNASTTAPAKVLVFLVSEKGQPLATPVQ